MGSTYHSLHYHIVFSTKDRRPFIRADWRPRLHEYLGGITRTLGGVAEIIGGVDDHVHLLISLRTTNAVSDIVRELKKVSSVWVTENHEPKFAWQEGYGVFTVSATHGSQLRRYIADQEEHHCKVSFPDEFRRILQRNGVDYDPRYLV